MGPSVGTLLKFNSCFVVSFSLVSSCKNNFNLLTFSTFDFVANYHFCISVINVNDFTRTFVRWCQFGFFACVKVIRNEHFIADLKFMGTWVFINMNF